MPIVRLCILPFRHPGTSSTPSHRPVGGGDLHRAIYCGIFHLRSSGLWEYVDPKRMQEGESVQLVGLGLQQLLYICKYSS
jgi:hypothetical protein